MACRNIKISKQAQAEIIAASNNREVVLVKLDISFLASVKEFCAEFSDRYSKLDILIHNAGAFNHDAKEYQLSPDNIELTFATNTFGPFLMSMLLKGLLAKSDDPRILHADTVNIKNFFDPKRKIDFDNLQGEYKGIRPYNAHKMYGDSKMALLMLTIKMAEVFEKEGIKVNAVMIPAIRISKDAIKKFKTFYLRTLQRFMNLISRTPEEMATTYYHICTSDEFRHVNGKLVNIKREIMKTPADTGKMDLKTTIRELRHMTQLPVYAVNRENIETIWQMSNHLVFKREAHDDLQELSSIAG